MTTPNLQLWPIGDSLTAPYVPTLAARIAAAFPDGAAELVGSVAAGGGLHHEGHGGYRIAKIDKNLDAYHAALTAQGKRPTAAIVVLGSNDVIGMPSPNISSLITQWGALLDHLRAQGVTTLVVATIPKTTIKPSPGVAPLNIALRAAAAKRGLPLVDLEKKLDPALLADGAHFKPEGAVAMGNAIADVTIPALRRSQSAGGGSVGPILLLAALGGLLLTRR